MGPPNRTKGLNAINFVSLQLELISCGFPQSRIFHDVSSDFDLAEQLASMSVVPMGLS